MNNLPEDMLLYIKENCYNSNGLLNLKKTNKQFNKLITRFSIQKKICSNLYKNFVNKDINICVNTNCYYDTWDLYEDIYHYGYRRYIHHHQYALNNTTIFINKKEYHIFSPYCSECLKNYVFIGDNKNVINNLTMNQVNIEYK